jgi:glutathione S-transferase
MRLYSGPMSMFGAKAQIAVLEKGIEAELVMVPFGLGRRYNPKDPEVLRINPKAQVPVLIDDGVELYDSTQIFEYLEDAYPDPPLWPGTPAERACARQLEHASDEVFFPAVARLMAPPSPDHALAQAKASDYHAQMDARLATSDYLAGSFSYADIAFFMASLFGEVLGAPIAADKPALRAWRRRMAARPAVAAVADPMVAYMERKGLDVASLRAGLAVEIAA